MSNNDKDSRAEAANIAKNLIPKEQWEADPIYNKIDQWMIEGVPVEKIRERVKAYHEKKNSK